MAEDWAAAAADVAAGLAEVGLIATLSTPSGKVQNAATGAVTGPTSTPVETAYAVVGEYSSFSIDEDKVRTGDVKLTLAALKSNGGTLTPPVADKTAITLAGDPKPWRVIRNTPEAPAGVAVMHTVQLRR